MKMSRKQFNEYAAEVGLNSAVDIARAMNTEAEVINHWCNELTGERMREMAVIIEYGNRARAAGLVH